jgi:hypothetical protein
MPLRRVLDTLDRLGDGTVATVRSGSTIPHRGRGPGSGRLHRDRHPGGVGRVRAAEGWPQSSGDVYGYPTCIDPGLRVRRELPVGDLGIGLRGWPLLAVLVRSAQENVVRALDNLADHPRIAADLARFSDEPFESAGRYVESEGRVATLVVTGPSQQVRAFVDENGFESGWCWRWSFYNWSTPLCGR